jgi:hypothetical protein
MMHDSEKKMLNIVYVNCVPTAKALQLMPCYFLRNNFTTTNQIDFELHGPYHVGFTFTLRYAQLQRLLCFGGFRKASFSRNTAGNAWYETDRSTGESIGDFVGSVLWRCMLTDRRSLCSSDF